MKSSPELTAVALTGNETFLHEGKDIGFDVKDFWRWAVSDLASNATRGVLAEFIVAKALGIEIGIRNEWDDYDIITKDGLKIEVKSSAYIQSWGQKKYSSPKFDIAPRKNTTQPGTGTYTKKEFPSRTADLYIFAVMKGIITRTDEPLDLDHWEFYVVKKDFLDEHSKDEKSISLTTLKKLGVEKLTYRDLGNIRHHRIESTSKEQMQLSTNEAR